LDIRGSNAISYTAPPEFFVFAWTGTGSGSYGFVVDDVTDALERPIAEWYPDGSHRGIVASSFADFLSLQFAPYDEQARHEKRTSSQQESQRERLRLALAERFSLHIPGTQYQATTLAANERLCAGAVPTEDGLGVMVPEKTVDRRYLGSLPWPSTPGGDQTIRLDERLFDTAVNRLSAGQVGTALVIARNIRFHYWYDDWKTSRTIIRRTCDIIAQCYEVLNRPFAAARIRKQTTDAIEELL
jgi:hypothetical protein